MDPKPTFGSALRNADKTVVAESGNRYIHMATADNTRRTYRAAIRSFERWGGRLPTQPATLAAYLSDQAAALNPRTLDVYLTALGRWHQTQGLRDPARDPGVRKTLEGIRRVHGRPKRQARALRLEHMAAFLKALQQQPDSLKKHRDWALLQVGFFGAFRRSELVAIEVKDMTWELEGIVVTLPHSKTDQQGDGLTRALPRGNGPVCPVRALDNWLKHAGIHEGPIFRAVNRWDQLQPHALSGGSVNRVLKILGKTCGLDFAPTLSSHSFRRGLSTAAARAKVDFAQIKRQGGWKHDATVRGYIEDGEQFRENAANSLIAQVAELVEKGVGCQAPAGSADHHNNQGQREGVSRAKAGDGQ